MSDLVVIAYPDEAAVTRARANLAAGIEQGLLDVEDVVVITSDEDGRIYPLLGAWEVGFASAGGALAGGLIGLVLLGPLLGMVAGGALAGHVTRRGGFGGISASFVNDIWENLTPGSAAMIVLVREMTPDKVLPHLREPGRVIQTTLDEELAGRLDAALQEARESR
jgi:uncharacterized membrane protein